MMASKAWFVVLAAADTTSEQLPMATDLVSNAHQATFCLVFKSL